MSKDNKDTKSIWCDRSLILAPYYCLCLTEKSFHRELKRFGGLKPKNYPRFLKTSTANATAHFFKNYETNKSAAIVCLGSNKGFDLIQIFAMLVHEATHIWQEVKALIGEDHPSTEFEAYSIQAISQELMYSYENQTKEKPKVKPKSKVKPKHKSK